MKLSSAVKQIPVYIEKNFRIFKNQKDWKFIVIAAVISLIVCYIVGKDMFVTYESTKMGFFAITCAAIWIGIFNSIQRICKEHDTITSEYRAGLHLSAYIMSHVIFDFFICLIQAVILTVICILFIDFPEKGIIFSSSIPEYFITLFLVIWCSDIMGIMISSVSANPNVAMTAMPFALILQLIMSGVLFKLDGISEYIANITYSKWCMSALGSVGDLNDPELPLEITLSIPQIVRQGTEEIYESTAENLLASWGCISLIGIICVIIAFVSLKIKNRGS